MIVMFTTDGTPCSTEAIREGARLLPHGGTDAYVLAVADFRAIVDDHGTISTALPMLLDRQRETVVVDLHRAVDLLAELGVRAVPLDGLGDPEGEILDRAAHVHADVVVLGAHDHTWFQRAFLGSVSDAVVHRWHGAALVVRHRPETAPAAPMVPHVLIATDGSDCAEHALEEAIRLLPLTDARVTLVGVADTAPYGSQYDPWFGADTVLADRIRAERSAALDRARARLVAAGVIPTVVERDGVVGPEIARLAAEIGPDLTVVGSHGRGAVSRWVMGCVSDHLLHHGTGATFVVWAPEATEG